MLSSQKVNIIALNQSIPINGIASVTLTIDITDLANSTDDLLVLINSLDVVEKADSSPSNDEGAAVFIWLVRAGERRAWLGAPASVRPFVYEAYYEKTRLASQIGVSEADLTKSMQVMLDFVQGKRADSEREDRARGSNSACVQRQGEGAYGGCARSV